MIKNFLAVGQIVGTHGVRGEMRVNPWADSPEFLKQFKTLYYDAEGKNSVGVISARPHGNIVLMKLEDIDTVEAASAMRNKRLYMRRSDARLPDGVYFNQSALSRAADNALVEDTPAHLREQCHYVNSHRQIYLSSVLSAPCFP